MVYGIKSLKKERVSLSISAAHRIYKHLIGNMVTNAIFLFRWFLFVKDMAIRYNSG